MKQHEVWLNGRVILSDLPTAARVLEDSAGVGAFVEFTTEPTAHDPVHTGPSAPLEHHLFGAGHIAQLARFTCCHRFDAFWMKPAAGTSLHEVPVETQYFLAERTDGQCVLVVPLIDGPFRCTLQGQQNSELALAAETGMFPSASPTPPRIVGMFVAAGDDPYTLLTRSAQAVMAHLKSGRLRHEKPIPRFFNLFGWCTWDAFYQDVSADNVRVGLQNFAAAGTPLKMLILDDGWQSVNAAEGRNRRLTALAANEKFPGDLTPTVQMTKQEFGIELFMVWHAYNGYWGGVNPQALPAYAAQTTKRRYGPGIIQLTPNINLGGSPDVDVVPPTHIAQFFDDYHRHIRAQGVDGVKVDNQAAVESFGHAFGGRTALYGAYQRGLEASVHQHFSGELINCMSSANEIFYGQTHSNVTRTSIDFWPDQPETHGAHLYTNAQVSAWFGEFTWPDWDMFQSGHAAGPFHAAGRAVSGGPIYVSDKIGAQNVPLLRKLVLPDGTTLRALNPGKPTRDCLFHDVTREDMLLKIFNHNACGAVIGVFNTRYAAPGQEPVVITGAVSPADVPHLAGDTFAVYSHNSQTLKLLRRDEPWPIQLRPLEFEIFTIVPVQRGFAPVGLANHFNSGGAITALTTDASGAHEIHLRAGGDFVAYATHKPISVTVDGQPISFRHEIDKLTVAVPSAGACTLRVK